MNHIYQLSSQVVYRQVKDELILIQIETGKIYYFNPSTEDFLHFFKGKKNLAQFIEARQIGSLVDEIDYLKNFCRFLLEKNILQKATGVPEQNETVSEDYSKPQYLRLGDKSLDELTFLCP